MYIHSFLKNLNTYRDDYRDRGWLHTVLSYFWKDSSENFFYNIGGYDFTLEELKHGLLRANKKPPTSFFRILSDKDERTHLLDGLYDPRIIFLCLDMPQAPEHIECFDDPDTLEEKLDYFLSEYFNVKVEIDTMNEEIILPKIIETYKGDLGGTDELALKFIWNWMQNNSQSNEFDLDQIIKLVNRKTLMIRYED